MQGCHDIFGEAMGIWKNNTKFRNLFPHPKRHLSVGGGGDEIDEYPSVSFEFSRHFI